MTISSVLWPIWKNKRNLTCLNIWFDVCFFHFGSVLCALFRIASDIYILCIDELCQLFEIIRLSIIETEAQQQRKRGREYCELIKIGTRYKNHCFHTILVSNNQVCSRERKSIQFKITYSSENHDDKFVKLLNQWHIYEICVYMITKLEMSLVPLARASHDTYTRYIGKLATIWIINANSSILFWAASRKFEHISTIERVLFYFPIDLFVF